MQNLLYKTKEHELVGQYITVWDKSVNDEINEDNWKWQGEITHVIPKKTRMDEESAIFFYGDHYPVGVLTAPIDRVRFLDFNSKHPIVAPLVELPNERWHYEIEGDEYWLK